MKISRICLLGAIAKVVLLVGFGAALGEIWNPGLGKWLKEIGGDILLVAVFIPLSILWVVSIAHCGKTSYRDCIKKKYGTNDPQTPHT